MDRITANTQLIFITFQQLAEAMKAQFDSQGKKFAGLNSFSYECVWLICDWIFFLAGLMNPLDFFPVRPFFVIFAEHEQDLFYEYPAYTHNISRVSKGNEFAIISTSKSTY
jgi:hypothetical protein